MVKSQWLATEFIIYFMFCGSIIISALTNTNTPPNTPPKPLNWGFLRLVEKIYQMILTSNLPFGILSLNSPASWKDFSYGYLLGPKATFYTPCKAGLFWLMYQVFKKFLGTSLKIVFQVAGVHQLLNKSGAVIDNLPLLYLPSLRELAKWGFLKLVIDMSPDRRLMAISNQL